MTRPLREDFLATLRAAYPGATVYRSDRGVEITCATADVAHIEQAVRHAGLTITHVGTVHGVCVIRVFGFPRRRS